MATAKIVMVLRVPAGNMWDIETNGGEYAGRYSYHGDRLVKIRQGETTVNHTAVREAIDNIYAAAGL